MAVLATTWRRALDVLLPAHCVGCGASETYLCDACLASAQRLPDASCPVCAAPGFADVCGRCRLRQPAFCRTHAAFVYDGVVRTAVHRMKYSNLRSLAPAMAEPMAQVSAGARADAVVPVPLHRSQLRRRGFNQSTLLAAEVAHRLGLPVREDLVERRLGGRAQVSVSSAEERWANVAYAFAPAGADATDMRLLLVDDVMTTGSTLHAAAGALMDAGAASIEALVFAREP